MLSIPLFLLVAHFVGDFVLQTDRMALGKSKRLEPLLSHALVYTLTIQLFLLGWIFASLGYSPLNLLVALDPSVSDVALKLVAFGVLTFGTHLMTDAITSRINARLFFFKRVDPDPNSLEWHYYWQVVEYKRYWFFVAVGADQLIHAFTLAWTCSLLFGA